MPYRNLALATAMMAVGMMACGGQVLDGPIPPPLDPPVDPPTQPPQTSQPDPPPTAPALPTAAPVPANTCLSLVYGGSSLSIVSIDLATGQVTEGVKVQAEASGPPPSSLGVFGPDLFYCDESAERIVQVSLADGATKFIPRPCSAITADAKGIYVMSGVGEIRHYDDLLSLQTNVLKEKLGSLHASRLGTSSQGLLAAWHSTSEILRLDGKLALDQYDDWIFGLSGAPGGRVIVSSPRADGEKPGLVAFDAATGKNLGVVARPNGWALGFSGLACGE